MSVRNGRSKVAQSRGHVIPLGARARARMNEPSAGLDVPRPGRLSPESRPDRLLVEVPGDRQGPARPALTTMRLPAAEWRSAAAERRSVLLLFLDGDPTRPVIVGFLHDGAAESIPGPPVAEARLDGLAVVLEARNSIELRCGRSSLLLRRDGRVVISGVELDARAEGVNRVRGGVVKIN